MTGVRPATSSAGTDRASGERPGSPRRAVLAVLRTCLVIGLLLVAYALAPRDPPTELSVAVRLAIWLVVVVLAVLWQIRAVMRSSHPWLRALQGAALSVALLVLPFATAYASISAADPATFTQPLTRLDALYFTVTVFATVGFGDISPVSEPARLLVTVQMLADLVLIGMIVKVLVGVAQRRRESLGPRVRPRDRETS
jgi:voltage-gated potassium channel